MVYLLKMVDLSMAMLVITKGYECWFLGTDIIGIFYQIH